MTKKSIVFGGTAVTLVGAGVGMMAMPSIAGASVEVVYNSTSTPGIGIWDESPTVSAWKATAYDNTSSDVTGSVWMLFYNNSGLEAYQDQSGTIAPGGLLSTPYYTPPSDAVAGIAEWKNSAGTIVSSTGITDY